MNVRLLCEMFGWPVVIMDPDVFEQLPRGRQRIRRAVAALLIEATHTERFLAVVVDRLVGEHRMRHACRDIAGPCSARKVKHAGAAAMAARDAVQRVLEKGDPCEG